MKINSDTQSESGWEDSSVVADGEWSEVGAVSERGAFNVWKGMRNGRWYAMKSVAPQYAGIEAYNQILRREFKIGVVLQHPHIAQTYSMEKVDGVGEAIIMEYIDGMTLGQYLKSKPTDEEREKITKEMMSAVTYLHEHQITHRDLKPSNILITRNSHNVKIIDLGLSLEDASASMLQPAGTKGYMAPEQMISGSKADCRADIYALGVILGEIWDKPTKGIRKIIERCTKENAEERPRNMGEMQRLWEEKDKWRRSFAAIAGMAMVMVIMAVFMLRANANQPMQETETMETEKAQVVVDTIVVTKTDTLEKAKEKVVAKSVAEKKPERESGAKEKKEKVEAEEIVVEEGAKRKETDNTKEDKRIYELYVECKRAINTVRSEGVITYGEAFPHINTFAQKAESIATSAPTPQETERLRAETSKYLSQMQDAQMERIMILSELLQKIATGTPTPEAGAKADSITKEIRRIDFRQR